MALTQERILSTALSLLSEYGLGDLSMRRVASELGVAPGALYYHVKNKQELLTLLAERMLASPERIEEPSGPLDPAETVEAVVALARTAREAIVPYPDGADVVGVAMAAHPESIRSFVEVRRCLKAAGLDERHADWGARTVLYSVLGFVSAEHNRARLTSPGPRGGGAEGDGASVAGFEAEACEFGVRAAVDGLLRSTKLSPPGSGSEPHYND
ncbi:TetR/AcrR family transcriptional regulator [Kocuria sp. HSID16901]|uniref:TetR/AcrR family transcriptional regulator n=1 Tax=Kocuria sp. HSID16901 TaxID=2419505 RepID=UPI0006601293|nr:TetR/AcrR family transcriptional regulator [Kocuria sp. HSID16901]MCT1368062.1 TetR/AcrR family transcriptional regulator [Rothia sp. p3-SID1597]RUQ21670.1 TetR/AcrR family transcriptional regulator [Kocuria sp. HSID16901]